VWGKCAIATIHKGGISPSHYHGNAILIKNDGKKREIIAIRQIIE
jgi:hypothetical protein